MSDSTKQSGEKVICVTAREDGATVTVRWSSGKNEEYKLNQAESIAVPARLAKCVIAKGGAGLEVH